MSRAVMSRAFAVAALAAILVVRSDSRGDNPPKQAKAPAVSPAAPAAKSPAKPQSKPVSKPPAQSAAKPTGQRLAQRVQQALAEPTEFDFVDTPLKDIVDSIADRSHINVLLDTKALANAGVTPDTTFTKSLKAIPLHSALHLLLDEKDLSYIDIDGNVLMITTADVAKAHLVVRVYDVRNFAEPGNRSSAKSVPLAGSQAGGSTFQVAGVVSSRPKARAHVSRTTVLSERDSGGLSLEHSEWDGIIELITSTVVPSSWDCYGGAGSICVFGSTMIVSQTDEIHAQIAELLSNLERACGLNPVAKLNGISPPLRTSSPAEAKIENALDSPTTMEYTDTPLIDVIDSLKARQGIEIQLDTKALTKAGVTPATAFTFGTKGISMRESLRLLLASKDLNYNIEHDVLLITTADAAKTKVVTAIYLVGNLVGGDSAEPDKTNDSLVEAITGTLQPQSWDENGGAGSIAPFPVCKVLVISQTREIHREIESWLSRLSAAEKPQPRVPDNSRPPAAEKKNPQAAVAPSNAPVVRTYPLWISAAPDDRVGSQAVEMIRKLVEPKSWSGSEAYIGFVGSTLVVRQTPDVHRQIQNLLDKISGASGPAPTGAR